MPGSTGRGQAQQQGKITARLATIQPRYKPNGPQPDRAAATKRSTLPAGSDRQDTGADSDRTTTRVGSRAAVSLRHYLA